LGQACARLPLALRIATANLNGQPGRSLASFVAELTAGNRLVALHLDDDEPCCVRGAFDLSYAALPPDAQWMFRRLGFAPGPDITPDLAATLAGTTVEQATRTMDRLVRAHLLAQPRPRRYTLHSLLRIYAADRAAIDERAATDGRPGKPAA
jgi:hypothetical protein